MGFISDIIDTFRFHVLNARDKELEERMKLKAMRDRIRKSGHGFIDFKMNAISEKFAIYIYHIYRYSDQFMKALRNDFLEKGGTVYAKQIIEAMLTQEQQELLASFSYENIMNAIVKGGDVNAVFDGVKQRFKTLQTMIDREKTEAINGTFNTLKLLAELSKFDMYMFLKTFDTTLPEGDYNYKPVFTSKDNRYLIDDIVKLDCAVNSMPSAKELPRYIHEFESYRGLPPMGEKNAKHLSSSIDSLRDTKALTDMIAYLSGDLAYTPTAATSTENIVSTYINDLAKDIKATADKIITALKSDRINKVLSKAFAGIELAKLTNYNEEKNSLLSSYQCLTFRFVEPLVYLKTFIIERYEQYIKDAVNQVLLEAEFVRKERQTLLSDAFYALNGTREAILAVDSTLSDNGEEGKRLKTLLLGMKKSKTNQEVINALVGKVDAHVNDVVKKSVRHVMSISEVMTSVLRDIKASTKKEIFNPAKFVGAGSKAIDRLDKTIADTSVFLSLMNHFIK
ncbi:MAG: DUF5312 family protein [Spirochaetota bacterium]